MNGLMETDGRRLLQPLWNALNAVLLPHLGGGICLAVSGGPDSRALLEAVARWKLRNQARWLVACVDHGMRLESKAEAQAVFGRARALGFPATILTLPEPPKRDEATLREARYQALWAAMAHHRLGSLCTAHHAGDDGEGFLMHILNGRGGADGASMGHVSHFSNGILLRPFLGLSKLQLWTSLVATSTDDAFFDPTNEAGTARRSEIRQHIIPHLKKFCPHIESRLSDLAEQRAKKNADRLDQELGLFRLERGVGADT